MQEKRRDGGTLPAAGPSSSAATSRAAEAPAAPEPTSTRRRAGGQKRKAANSNVSGALSAPSKRLAREKPPLPQPPAIHNGPCTRARQAPNNLSAAPPAEASGAGASRWPQAVGEAPKPGETAAAGKEARMATVDWDALERAAEAEFEAVRSRDANAHAVPNFCGWFSWTKIHPLEQRSLPSFFNGKSESRTADIYMEIRNWIMKKYHADPSTEIEQKDLSELSVGDTEARQEVMEFLDHWGLINFHPFPPAHPAGVEPAVDGDNDKDSSLEELYRFEGVQPCLPVAPKTSALTPVMPSGWLPESAFAEELVRSEGPAVEYHCNSCSADCSRKRYHCQKQADFDLCTECYNNGKFDSDMVSSDFILMEPAEVPGLSSGKWTDQETLLLLEALELFKENWNEIAEHVATKTKAQCILHFVQMPIEDTFLDRDDEIDANTQAIRDSASTENDSSIAKDAAETTENKNACEDQPSSSPMEISNPENAGGIEGAQGTDRKDTNENFAFQTLMEAFETVGYPVSGSHFSFAEAGNPVMALAAFLVQLVEPELATATARCSLKSLSADAPGMELATRHCFLLDDLPDVKKELTGPERAGAGAEIIDKDAQKDDYQDKDDKQDKTDKQEKEDKPEKDDEQEEEGDVEQEEDGKKEKDDKQEKDIKQGKDNKLEEYDKQGEDRMQEDNTVSNLSGSNMLTHSNEKNMKEFVPELKEPNGDARESGDVTILEEIRPGILDKANHSKSSEDQPMSMVEESRDLISKSERPGNSVKESIDKNSIKKSTQHGEDSAKDSFHCGVGTKDLGMPSGSVVPERRELQQSTSSSMVENGKDLGEPKDSKNETSNSTDAKDGHNIDKLKHAAITALSAAAVKAKLLADQEEDQIRQLAVFLIEKQLYKLETKFAFFNEMESVIARVRELLERSRAKLYHERAQIIAARFGYAASASKPMPQSLPNNRIPVNHAHSMPRPPFSTATQRPSVGRPTMASTIPPSNLPASPAVGGSSMMPPSQDHLSSVGMK